MPKKVAPKRKPPTLEQENTINLAMKELRDDLAGEERRYYAGAALMGLCATRSQYQMHSLGKMAPELAATAYLIADAMVTLKKYSAQDLHEFLESKKPKEP